MRNKAQFQPSRPPRDWYDKRKNHPDIAALRTIIRRLRLHGWRIDFIWDGEESNTHLTTKDACMVASNLDSYHIHFRRGKATSWVYLINGQFPDVICDFSVNIEPIMGPICDRFEEMWEGGNR